MPAFLGHDADPAFLGHDADPPSRLARERETEPLRARRAFCRAIALGLGAVTLGARPALAQPPTDREPADPGHLTPEESAHVPVLVLPRRPRVERPFDLIVQIGDPTHTMAEHHRIAWIEVLAGGARVFRAELGPAVAFPVVRVPLVLTGPTVLTARAQCNQHGVWRTRREVEVG